MPHELIDGIESGDEIAVLQFMSIIRGTKLPENFLFMPVVDVSGSMSGHPMKAAVALGLILAYSQPEDSPFARKFLSFSRTPQAYQLPPIFGPDKVELARVVTSVMEKDAGLNTDFIACMSLMLNMLTRTKGDLDKTNVLVVFTDMGFDIADDSLPHSLAQPGSQETHLERLKRMYADAGVRMPIIVFWNLRNSTPTAVAPTFHTDVVILSGLDVGLMKTFFEMLGSGQFKSAHAAPSLRDCEGEDEGGQNLNTDGIMDALLSRDEYKRYKDV